MVDPLRLPPDVLLQGEMQRKEHDEGRPADLGNLLRAGPPPEVLERLLRSLEPREPRRRQGFAK